MLSDNSQTLGSMEHANLVLVCLCVFYFLENVDRYLIGVARVPYIDYHSLEYSILAGPAVTVTYSVVGLLIALTYQERIHIFGIQVDKLTLLSVVALIFSGSFLLTAVASQFWQLCFIRVTMGAMQSIITPFSSSIITEQHTNATRGVAFGVFGSATYVAFSFTLSVGTYIYNNYGWRVSYLLFGTISTALALPLPCYKAVQLIMSNCNVQDPYVSVGMESHHGDVEMVTDSPLRRTKETETELIEDEDNSTQHESDTASSSRSFKHMYQSVKDILCKYWWEHRYIYTAALATGVRLGAGYIWSNYTSLFFSPLFLVQFSGDLAGHAVSCAYSYSAEASLSFLNTPISLNSPNTICGEAYPYCVEGVCKALTSSPWHNKGMSGERLAAFMWWVPLVGSALGNVLGGLVSDRAVAKTIQQPSKTTNNNTEDSDKMSELSDTINLANDGVELDFYPEQRVLKVKHLTHERMTMNMNTNSSARTDANVNSSSAVRFLVCSLGNLLALPFVCGAVLLDYPYCFIVQVFSGLLAEMYLGQTLVVVSDTALAGVPKSLCTPSVALFMLVVTLIGGNIPLFIPFFENVWGYTETTIHFSAAASASTTDYVNVTSGIETFSARNPDSRRLQYSMLTLFVLCYGLSSMLYFCAYLQLKGKAVKPIPT